MAARVDVTRAAVLHMTISLKPQHLNRYRQIAWLFMKYGRSDLVKASGLDEALNAEKISIKSLAPEFEALTRLQDKVEPCGFDEVEKIVSSERRRGDVDARGDDIPHLGLSRCRDHFLPRGQLRRDPAH